MYQRIHETISVIGVYKEAAFVPKKFLWNSRVYRVDEITFVTNVRDGGVQKRMYSLISKGNAYRVVFNRDEETWKLEEVWCD